MIHYSQGKKWEQGVSVMTNLVVAVDGSECSMQALSWAEELAKVAPAPVFHLVHSCQLPIPIAEAQAFQYPALLAQSREDGNALLKRAAEQMKPGATVRYHLTDGHPVDAVLEVADNEKADLIVVGRRGLGRAVGILLGSVSTAIVHGAKVPVLVVHNMPAQPIERVLVGVDGSEPSSRALSLAAKWAPQASLAAMHVAHIPTAVRSFFQQAGSTPDEAVERIVEEVVAKTTAQAELGDRPVKTLWAEGDPGTVLASSYENGQFDLAVIGNRGLGTLQELVLGSVSERLLRLATGPVLVTK
jgi:nucleotide-binding universal stress UspA family protein